MAGQGATHLAHEPRAASGLDDDDGRRRAGPIRARSLAPRPGAIGIIGTAGTIGVPGARDEIREAVGHLEDRGAQRDGNLGVGPRLQQVAQGPGHAQTVHPPHGHTGGGPLGLRDPAAQGGQSEPIHADGPLLAGRQGHSDPGQ